MQNKLRKPLTVVAVNRNLSGSIEGYLLSNDVFVSRKQIVQLVEGGWIFGYVVATDKFGGKSIKTTPNSPVERLQSLPDISDINPLKYKSIQNMHNTPNS